MGCAAGYSFTVLVSDEGCVFVKDTSSYGQLSLGHTNDVNTPHEMDAAHVDGAPIAAAACGQRHMLALMHEGKLFRCEGHGPRPALTDTRVVRITANDRHSIALVENGHVFGFGAGGGISAGGAQGVPQLLVGAVTDATVCGGSCHANVPRINSHTVFIAGLPPTDPGFEPLLVLDHACTLVDL